MGQENLEWYAEYKQHEHALIFKKIQFCRNLSQWIQTDTMLLHHRLKVLNEVKKKQVSHGWNQKFALLCLAIVCVLFSVINFTSLIMFIFHCKSIAYQRLPLTKDRSSETTSWLLRRSFVTSVQLDWQHEYELTKHTCLYRSVLVCDLATFYMLHAFTCCSFCISFTCKLMFAKTKDTPLMMCGFPVRDVTFKLFFTNM